MQLLADLPRTPSKSSEHKGRVASFDLHHLCVGVVQRSFLRKPNAHTVLKRCKLFARGLQWGPEATRLRSRLRMRGAYREMPTYGARLRARFAIFLGKANRCDYECLSSAATGQFYFDLTALLCATLLKPADRGRHEARKRHVYEG